MKNKTIKIILVAVGAFVFAAFFAWMFGWYPIARIGDNLVWKRDFDIVLGQQKRISKAISSQAQNIPDYQSARGDELEDLAFEKLLEKEIIHQTLVEQINDSDIRERLVRAEIVGLRSNNNFHKAALSTYGGSFDDIEEYVLIPQVERDLLASRLFLQNQSFNDWLAQKKKEVEIIRYSGYSESEE